jgi:hypothetical protein
MKNGRLSRLFQRFASEYELLCSVSPDGHTAKLGIQLNSLIIQARIIFDEEDTWYQFGAVLKSLDHTEVGEFATKVLSSEPMTGLTERFLDNKFVIMGSRDNLDKFSDAQITNFYMEDVDKIRVYQQTHQNI